MLFQHVVHRNPVDASGFHRRRGDAAMDQPFGHLVKIAGEGLALANRMVIPVRRYGNINLPSSNIDARSIRFKQRRLDLLALTAPFTMNHLRLGFIRRWLLWLMHLRLLRLGRRPSRARFPALIFRAEFGMAAKGRLSLSHNGIRAGSEERVSGRLCRREAVPLTRSGANGAQALMSGREAP